MWWKQLSVCVNVPAGSGGHDQRQLARLLVGSQPFLPRWVVRSDAKHLPTHWATAREEMQGASELRRTNTDVVLVSDVEVNLMFTINYSNKSNQSQNQYSHQRLQCVTSVCRPPAQAIRYSASPSPLIFRIRLTPWESRAEQGQQPRQTQAGHFAFGYCPAA